VAPDQPRIPARFIAASVLILGDLLTLEAAVFLGVLTRTLANRWFPIEIGPPIFAGVAVAVLFMPFAYAASYLYPGYGKTGVERLRKRVIVTFLCFSAMILFDYLAQDGKWSRGILLAAASTALIAIPIWDEIARHFLVKSRYWGEAAIILGPADRRLAVIRTLRENPELGWIPVLEGELSDPPVLNRISLALVVLPAGGIGAPAMADDLPYHRVVLVPEVDGVQSLWVQVRDLGTHIGLEMRRNLLMPGNQWIKRGLDLVLGAVLLVLTAPVAALFAGLVQLVSPGPVFYAQSRAGKDGKSFAMWKLRTMRADADRMLNGVIAASETARADWERVMKIHDDPRIIPVLGHAMRRFSIDELPQFWNVLRGEMSLVGPRPLPAYHVARLNEVTDRLRQRIRPGITGLWQVSGRSNVPLTEQQRLDLYYLRNWSLWLDLHILARTVVAVLTGTGA